MALLILHLLLFLSCTRLSPSHQTSDYVASTDIVNHLSPVAASRIAHSPPIPRRSSIAHTLRRRESARPRLRLHARRRSWHSSLCRNDRVPSTNNNGVDGRGLGLSASAGVDFRAVRSDRGSEGRRAGDTRCVRTDGGVRDCGDDGCGAVVDCGHCQLIDRWRWR